LLRGYEFTLLYSFQFPVSCAVRVISKESSCSVPPRLSCLKYIVCFTLLNSVRKHIYIYIYIYIYRRVVFISIIFQRDYVNKSLRRLVGIATGYVLEDRGVVV
jgi:hypothetical protein